ncbi:DUF4870 domain-containing protein [Silanimonas sp.]|jgi:uncharacterized Tic20 family protein|uniref:DUF4870 domain-containing protein n=2 Tax=Silanimonas sp. TaxID=1929290 RepID=UPI0022CAD0E9|nr:DUF4870 domain-containing protein [Silanimonas sp.]MCZ8114837.1 DUF4870 domain-containing protein [Silanimonas sp.]
MSDAFSPPPSPGGEVSADQRQMALFSHLSSLSGLIIPLGNILGPLILWLVKKDTMPFVEDQAKEALNFNITLGIIGIVLTIITVVTFGIGAVLTVPLGILLGIAWLVLTIMAGLKANEGQYYRYPFALRLIK